MSEPGPGHNLAREQIKSIIERVENLETEIQERRNDQKDIYTEAKSTGLDVRALRTIVRMRKQDANQRKEQEIILETYMQALGML